MEVTNGPTAWNAGGDLATRISDCIAEADAGGLHVVAAHLETALWILHPPEDRAAHDPGRQQD